MSDLFARLTARYKAARIDFPSLKPVTLAQWILESGRGTSRLAIDHHNFGGLKWREEMTGFATRVEYDAHDGRTSYCKFSSLDAYIAGYWKFLSRSPYKGWEAKAAEGPESFIAFIGKIYNPANAAYANTILGLAAEAEQRLHDAVLDPPLPPPATVTVVLDPGHGGAQDVNGSSANNAVSPSGEKEKDWTLDIAVRTRAALLAKAAGRNFNVVLTRETDANKGLGERANVARGTAARFFVSIHFNAVEKGAKKARGPETWIRPLNPGTAAENVNLAQDRAFARTVQSHIVRALNEIDPSTKNRPKYDRGVKEAPFGVLSDVALGNTFAASPCAACLVEIEFMDTVEVEQLFSLKHPAAQKNRQFIAEALADALLVTGTS